MYVEKGTPAFSSLHTRSLSYDSTLQTSSSVTVRMQSTIVRLPADVCGLVIANLPGDKATLRSCALVSRDWLYDSRRQLFHTIRVTSKGCGGDSLIINLHAFRVFLQDSPSIGRCVRYLKILAYPGSLDTILNPFSISELVSLMPKLSKLRLNGIELQVDAIGSISSSRLPYETVLDLKTLELWNVNGWNNTASREHILQLFPALEALIVYE